MEYEPVKLKDVPRGEFIRRKPDASTTYRKGEYDRECKKYWVQDYEDVGRGMLLKGDTVVYIGFTY